MNSPTTWTNFPSCVVLPHLKDTDVIIVHDICIISWVSGLIGHIMLGTHISTCWISTIRNPDVWGEPRGRTCVQSADYHVKRNNIQSESELTEDGSIKKCSHGAAQKHLDSRDGGSVCWFVATARVFNVSCKTYLLKSQEILWDFPWSQSGICLKICWGVVCCFCHIVAHHTL